MKTILKLSALIAFLTAILPAFSSEQEQTSTQSGINANYIKIGYFQDSTAQNMSNEDFQKSIDKFIEIGFTGVMFEITLSITDEIEFYEGASYERLYEWIKIAEDNNLATSILPNWTFNGGNADYVETFRFNNRGIDIQTFDKKKFLKVLSEYWDYAIPIFRDLGVDLINFGLFNEPYFFEDNLIEDWKAIINSARSKYKGALSITYHKMTKYKDHNVTDFKIWSLLDVISIWSKVTVSETSETDIDLILERLRETRDEPTPILTEMRNAYEIYQKPLLLFTNAFAIENGLDGGWDPSPSQLNNYPNSYFPEILELAYKSNLHFFSLHLSDIVSGWSIGNWETWAYHNINNWGFFDLTYFPEKTISILSDFLSNGYYVATSEINGTGNSEDIFLPTDFDQPWVINSNGGADNIRGGKGNDLIVINSENDKIELTYSIYLEDEDATPPQIELEITGSNTSLNVSVEETSCEIYPCWKRAEFELDFPSLDNYSTLKLKVDSGFIDLENFRVSKNFENINLSFDNSDLPNIPEWVASNTWILSSTEFDISSLNFLDSRIKIDGGRGLDTLKFEYTESQILERFYYSNIEKIVYTDKTILIGREASFLVNLLGAIAGKDAAFNPDYLSVGYDLLYSGMTQNDLSYIVANYVLGEGFTAEILVNKIFTNILNRSATNSEIDLYSTLFDAESKASVSNFISSVVNNEVVSKALGSESVAINGVRVN